MKREGEREEGEEEGKRNERRLGHGSVVKSVC